MAAPRTILFLHPSAELYGADQTLLHLVTSLDRARWRAVVALPRRGPLATALEEAGARIEIARLGIGARADVRLARLPRLWWGVLLGALAVRRLIRRHAPALVHSNTLVVLGGALGAWSSGVPHLWHVHEILERPRWLARAFARLLARAADLVVANSAATAESFVRWHPPLARRMRVVPNGVPAERLAARPQARAAERARLGLADADPLVLLVGRVNAWKGQGLLLEAAARLTPKHRRALYLCVGDAPEGQEWFGQELDRAMARTFLGDRFRREPFRADVADLFAAADVCVVPSTLPEPFGLVAVEAMAAGRAVVAADHGGLVEIVEHEVTGLRFAPGDPEALAEALERLLSDRALRERLGAAGRERQRSRFTVERYAQAIGSLHGEIARAGERPALPAHAPLVHVVLGKANPDRPNGVNRFVDQLARAQARAGRNVQVWGLTATPESPTPARPYGLRLFHHVARSWRLERSLRRALAELEAPALVHLHGGLVPAWRALSGAARRAGHQVVLTPHGAYRSLALRRRALAKRIHHRLFDRKVIARARVHALVEREAREMERWVPPSKIVVLPSGQDPLQAGAPARERRGERPLFGYLGRLLAHTKGLDLLVDAFAAHVARGGRGRLVLAGEGPDREALEARAGRSGLALQARFVGGCYGAAKVDFLADLDVFVHPSRHEGLPGAVLEAASLALPLIVSEGTNLGPCVRSAGAGVAVDDENVRQLSDALGFLAEEYERGSLSERGRRARAMASELFDWGRIEERFAAELYSLEGDEAARAAPTVIPGRPFDRRGKRSA